MATERRVAIVWAPSAERDLGRIHEFLHADSPRRAARMAARVLEAVELLELQPDLGEVAKDVEPVGRCRHLVVAPLRVIYQVADRQVRVLRIWDSRRDPRTLRVAPASPDDSEPG